VAVVEQPRNRAADDRNTTESGVLSDSYDADTGRDRVVVAVVLGDIGVGDLERDGYKREPRSRLLRASRVGGGAVVGRVTRVGAFC
jgi:hypothetical protein